MGGCVRVGIAAAAITVVWGVLLPRLARTGPVARHVASMRDRGVDPSAMYYTELERLPLRPPWVERMLVLWP